MLIRVVHRKFLRNVVCSERMLCGVYSFVHNFVRSGSGVEFVLNGFDLASRIKTRTPHKTKKLASWFRKLARIVLYSIYHAKNNSPIYFSGIVFAYIKSHARLPWHINFSGTFYAI